MSDFIPDADFKPDEAQMAAQPAPASSSAAFIPDSDFTPDEDKYGSAGQQALAGVEGALRGGTLGLSDLAETKLGLSTPEAIAARKQYNPVTSFLGNTAGGAAAIGLTGGLAAPLEAGAGAAGLGGIAAKALGYGAEGALFGGGNAVSDYALGDPKLNAQKVMSEIGLGALFGAGLGAGVGALSGKAEPLVETAVNDVSNEANNSEKLADALSKSQPETSGASGAASTETKSPLFSLTPVDKKIAPKLRAIGDEYGLPVTNGMTSDIKSVQQATDVLASGAPTLASRIIQGELKKGWDGATQVLNGVLDTGADFGGGEMTAKQLGDALKESLKAQIVEDNAPLSIAFDAIKNRGIPVPVDADEVANVTKDLLKNPNIKFGGSDSKIINEVNDILPKLQSAEDISNYQKYLKQEYPFQTTTQNERHILGQVQDHLQNIFESSVENAAKDESLPEDLRNSLKTIGPDIKNAKAQYAEFQKKFSPVIDQLGGRTGTGKGAAYMKNFVDDLDPEKLSAKLFDKKYSEFNEHFQKEFPQDAALMQQYMKQIIKQKSLGADGQLNPSSLFKQVFGMGQSKGLEPEIRSSIFGSDELKKMQDMKDYLGNFPKKFNPSGTEGAMNFRAGFSPAGHALAEATDFGILAYIKAAGRDPNINGFQLGAEAANKFNAMNAVQKMADQADQKMQQGAKAIFSASDASRGAALSAGTQGIDSAYSKAQKGIANLANNPAGIADHVASHVGGLSNSIPNISQGISQNAITALDFLNSKMPKPSFNYPGQKTADFKPSQLAQAKFMKYYNAVNNPISVLKDVRSGTLSSESLEALQAVHPELYNQMKVYVQNQMAKKSPQTLPYGTKLSIAKFLGQPIDASMQPHAIQANQASLSGPQLGTQQAQPTGRKAHMSKFAIGDRTSTISRDRQSGDKDDL